ncbi:hypothetical protein RIF29_07669 [Crotalaria pallida]|uniref:Uncharacterized protein n=1 Tax=Crotalaria pallida TaxID=3830 RepID=A0AAN9PC75_CROPI
MSKNKLFESPCSNDDDGYWRYKNSRSACVHNCTSVFTDRSQLLTRYFFSCYSVSVLVHPRAGLYTVEQLVKAKIT